MRKLKKVAIFIVVLASISWAYVDLYGNFHKIDTNVYRSAQLNSVNMPFYLQEFHIKSILNLRGAQPQKKWYQTEQEITQENNVSLLDFDMWSGQFYDFNQTSKLLQIIKDAPKPLLIHCIGGADRTSLASALYVYGIKKASESTAKEQLAWYYGHLPSIRPHVKAMDKSFENFVLKSQGKAEK